MSLVLSALDADGDEGGKGAQTGSILHKAVEVFHRTPGSPQTRQEAAVAEIARAAMEFPKGDRGQAGKWCAAYVADKANIDANVRWLEQSVTLEWMGVTFKGTLDQVRQYGKPELLGWLTSLGHKDWVREVQESPEETFNLVWDLKTSGFLDAVQSKDEHQVQQAIYVLAARQTLDAAIVPGGLILYQKDAAATRGSRFVPMNLTVPDCERLVTTVAERVSAIRKGARDYTPSAGACGFCPHRAFPKCTRIL